jgi:magnesium transporter
VDYRPERIPEADDLEELIERGEEREIKNFLALLHPADLAMLFDTLDRDLWPNVIAHLDIAHISDLMEELPDHLRDDLAELLRPDQLTDAFEEMASDDAADVITDLPDDLAQAVLASLPAEDREEVETLLKYPEDSAGGKMQMELVSVVESATVDQAVEAIRANVEEVGDLHFVYVVDDEQRLMGALSLEKLILAKSENPIAGLVDRDVRAVTPGVDQEEVALMFKRYDLVSLPVIDGQGRLLGRILHDDVVDVFEEEADEDILRMAGANEPELVYTDRIFKIASVRLPWLLATLGGTMLTGLLLWLFKLSFPHILALLPFIPIIGAMGGNVGSQSAIIVVRGFATGRIDYHNLGRFLANELVISLIMGICCGLATGIIAHIWHGDTILGWTVGLSMLVAVIASAILGVLVPFLFKLIRIDPAIASGPLVTTIDDIIAIGIYYLFALLMLTGRGA